MESRYLTKEHIKKDMIFSATDARARPYTKGILKECKNNNVPIDENLNCSIGHVFTIFAKHWTTKGLEPPTVYTLKFVE